MTVAVLIPVAVGGDPWRQRALDFVTGHWVGAHPDWELCFGKLPDGPWCKGEAVRNARDLTDADVLVIADADVVCDPDAVVTAVTHSVTGNWAMPHGKVLRLDETASTHLYDTGLVPANPTLARPVYYGYEAGGLVVVRADVYDACPIDRRFVGWGSEDVAWGQALHCLYGPAWRGEARLWHLWHPHPAPGQSKNVSVAGRALARRYYGARTDPAAMREVLVGA